MSEVYYDYNNPRNRPVSVDVDDESVCLNLADGRRLVIPIDWFPFLKRATREQRKNYRITPFAVEWDELDDGIDIQAMIAGNYLEPSKTAQSADSTEYIRKGH